MVKRTETIKDKKIFTEIIKNGKFKKNQYYVIYIMKREDEKTYFGIAISKTIGKAYLRNKLKRQTRAIIDNNRKLFEKSHNYIIMIRKSCKEATFKQMNNAIVDLLEKR